MKGQRRPSGSSSSAETETKASTNAASAVRSSCKTMQRKLEQKVERTRNLLTHKMPLPNTDLTDDPRNPPLMPVSRMRIPGQPDCLPLVDYRDSRTGMDIDDNEDDVDFYPIAKKSSTTAKHHHHELSDTFSLHEMTICDTGDEDEDATNVDTRTAVIFDDEDDEDDDDDSQTLEFLSPKLVRSHGGWKERCSHWFCCGHSSLRL